MDNIRVALFCVNGTCTTIQSEYIIQYIVNIYIIFEYIHYIAKCSKFNRQRLKTLILYLKAGIISATLIE